MVDRASRDRVIEVIRSYMNDQISAFQFDEMLGDIGGSTGDKTVQAVVRDLWFYYDDCKDHKIVASKHVWDHFNRLLLLLTSDSELRVIKVSRNWYAGQFVAMVSLAALLYLMVRLGTYWGPELLGLTVPFGVVSMVIGWLNSRRRKKEAATINVALTPFSTLRSLLTVRRRTRDFKKRKYPNIIADRRFRDPLVELWLWIPRIAMWLMFSPIVLFVQMVPKRESETVVVTPELWHC